MKPLRHSLLPVCTAFLVATFSICFPASANADDIYWDGATNGSWNDISNWSTNSGAGTPDPAVAPASGDTVHFSIPGQTGSRTVNLTTNQEVQGIVTENLTGTVSLRTGGTSPLSLMIGAGGIDHLRGGVIIGNTADVVNVVLAASQSWNSATAGTGASAIMVVNDVSGAAGNHTLTLTGFNTGSYVGGGISDGAGTVSIVKEGEGIWELRGTNNYSGSTRVNEGILRLANAAAVSPASVITVADNATFGLKTANSAGTTGFSSAQISDLLASPNLVFTSSAGRLGLDTGNGSFNHDGNLAGAFTLEKLGGSVLTLSGTNSHTGSTLITAGGIAIANDTAISANSTIMVGADTYLTVTSNVSLTAIDHLLANTTFGTNATFGYDTSPGNLTLSDAITGSHGLAKTGSNILFLDGTASNTYTGLTHLAGGTLALAKAGGATAVTGDLRISTGTLRLDQANQITDTANVTLNGGSFNFNGKSETISSLTVNGGSSVSTGTSGTMSVGELTRTGTTSKITVNSGAKLVASNVTLSGDNIPLNGTAGGNILIGGTNTSVVTELQLTGNLTMTNQTIQVNAATATQKGTRVTLEGDFTGNGVNEINVSGTTATLADFALTAGDHTFTINNSGSGSTVVAGDTLIGLNISGVGNISKAGAGTLSLSGNNTYTGITHVDNGIIRVLSNTALGGSAAGTEVAGGAQVRLENNVTVTGETLRLTGTSTGGINAGLLNFSGDNVWDGAVTVDTSVSQNVRINMTGGTLDIRGDVLIDSGSSSAAGLGIVLTGATGTGTISGDISGTGSNQNLIKNGTSTWVISGNNTYTGVTRVDDGILSVSSITNNLGNPSSTDNGRINLGENATSGTFRYTGTGEVTDRGVRLRSLTTGSGTLEQAGTGNLLITGEINGASTSSDKTLTLTGSTSGTGELSGLFSDTAGNGKTHLVKSGTGTWTLSGAAKAYEGTTGVTGGSLNVTTSLTQSTAITVEGGTFRIGANDVIKDDATVTLGEGGVLQVAGFADAAGVLAVTGNALLELSGGNNALSFASSSSADWTGGILAVTGWAGLTAGNDEISFDAAGLTEAQLAAIHFVNPQGFAEGTYNAKFLDNQLVPDALIPEPSALLMLVSGLGGLIFRRSRMRCA